MSLANDTKPRRWLCRRLCLVSALALLSSNAAAQPTADAAPAGDEGKSPEGAAARPAESPAAAESPASSEAGSPAGSPPSEPFEEAPATPGVGTEPTLLGEVIITARRRNEGVQDVPIAVNVLGGDALEGKGTVNLQSFHREVPSVTSYSTNPRNTTINIRGLGTNVAGSGVGFDAGVGFYVDDVYYNRLSTSSLNLLDVERIEVLRGPQGTLFGRNTTAGAISVYTRQPSFSRDANADLTIGNYGFLQARGSVSGPLIDDVLAARVSVEALTRDGFLQNDNLLGRIHGQDGFQVRGQLLYEPTESFRVRFTADYLKQAVVCCIAQTIGIVTAYDDGTPIAYPYLDRVAQFNYTPIIDPRARTVDSNRSRPFRVVQGGTSLRADWDLEDHTLTSISAARFWFTSPRNDGDATALDIIREGNTDDRQGQGSEELRIASSGKKSVDYVAGGFFYYQHLPITSRTEYGPQAGEFFIAPGTDGLTPEQRRDALDGAHILGKGTSQTVSYAPFAQATWHILSSLDLTLGSRYTYERKFGNYEQFQRSRVDISGLNEAQLAQRAAMTPAIPRYELDKTWHSLSALVTVSQKVSDNALVYATYSRGSKSGGLNLSRVPPDIVESGLAVVGPETVDHFELGLKSQWLHPSGRVLANVTLFHTTIDQYQNTIRDTGREPARSYITNVGSVRSQGLEVELQAKATEGLSLNVAGTYADAIYSDYRDALCAWEVRAPGQPTVCDLSGQRLPVAPTYSGSVGGVYTVRLGEGLNGFIGVDYSHRSPYRTTSNNSRYSRVPASDLINARLGLSDSDGRWEATAWSNNVFDELYFHNADINEQNGEVTALLGDPRTFGVLLRYYFY